MNILIFKPKNTAFSIRNYITNIINYIQDKVKVYLFLSPYEFESFNRKKIDLIWFPNCGWGALPPYRIFFELMKNKENKVIITFHGAAPYSLSKKDFYDSFLVTLKGETRKYITFILWQFYKRYIRKTITVSSYAKNELISKLKFSPFKVEYIYHGVNMDIFNSLNSKMGKGEYFLHVSQYQPKKNLDRIIKAYKNLKIPNKPKLLIISPGYNKKIDDNNIEIIRQPQKPEQLALFYKNALAFIFPSLHETFGMPILEAMACGCPVITSNTTGCAEIAGNAALLVNPYSIEDITNAMERIMKDDSFREYLSNKGIERAKQFTWKKSAEEHLKVFEEILREK